MGKITDKLFNKFDNFAQDIYNERYDQLDKEEQDRMLREAIYQTGEIENMRKEIMEVLLTEIDDVNVKKRVMNGVKQVFEKRYGEFKG